MAKRKDEFDFDDDLDFDLDKELGGMGFGDNSAPPKNKREAITRSVKDAGRGFKNELFDNKLKTAGKLAKNSIPKSLSAEFGEISGLASDVKDIVSDSISDIKKQTSGLSRALGKLLPENSKLSNLLNKVSEKLDDNSHASQEASKAEHENNEIQSGILAALGELKDKSHTDAMLQQAIQNKQFASNIEMLKNIYAETKLQRLFNYEITNAYYRKSLELQYKQLFTQREILEVQKLAFTTHRNQLETVILNTALPDYLKARGKEALEYTIKQRARDLVAGSLFKSGGGFDRFSKNITRKLKGFISGVKEGLSSSTDMIDMFGDMSTMYKEIGMRPGEMLGSSAANFLNQYVGGKIGKLIENSKWGKEFIFNTKEAMVDPKKFFKNVANKKDPKGIYKLFSKAARFGLGFTEDPSIISTNYNRGDLDESAMFDGRAHQSLTKVIPGLLSKIYAETKMLRTGMKIHGDSSVHELVFDNRDDRFKTKKQLVRQINAEIKVNLKSNFKNTANHIHQALSNMGVGISGSEANVINRALLNYSMQPGSSVTAGSLYDPEFLVFIQDPKLADKLAKNAAKMRQYLLDNPNEQEWISSIFSSLKNNLPNLNKRYEDLYKSGHTDILKNMGVAKISKYNGNLESNISGIKKQIYANYTDEIYDYVLPSSAVGKSSSILGQRAGNAIDKKSSDLYAKVKNITAEDIITGSVNGIATAADYASKGLNKASDYVNKADAAIEKRFGHTKAYKAAKELSKKAKVKAKKYKSQIEKNKKVQAILNSKSVKTVSGYLVDGANKVEDFFGRPKEEISADLNKAYKDAKSAATNFINKTTTAITSDTDVQALEHSVKEGMAEISSITKKIILGEATKEDIDTFKEKMKARGEELSNTAKSAGRRGKALAKDGYAVAKKHGIKAKGKVKELSDKVSQDERFQTVASKVKSGWDTATNHASRAAAAAKDPKEALKLGKNILSKIYKKLMEKSVDVKVAMRIYAKWLSDCQKEGIMVNMPFLEWCERFHVKLKEPSGPGGIKGFFQWTRKLDRKLWTSMMGVPFKFVGGMLSNTRIGNTLGKIPVFGKLTGLKPSGISAQAGNITAKTGGVLAKGAVKAMDSALDILPFGMGEVVRAPFHIMKLGVDIMGDMMSFIGLKSKQEDKEKKKEAKEKAKQEKLEKEKNSSDGWMSRLKLWGRKKTDSKNDEKNKKSIMDKLKENKTPLTIMGALLGIWGFTKMFNIGLQDVLEGVKSVVGTVVNLGKGLYDILGGGFTGLAGVIAAAYGIKKLGGWALGKAGGWVAGKIAKGAGTLWSGLKNKITGGSKTKLNTPSIDSKGRYRTPDGKFAKNPNTSKKPKKTPKVSPAEGKGLWSKLSRGVKFFLSPIKDKVITVLSKLSGMWKTVKGKLGFLKKAVTKPKVLKKIGAKAATKLTSYIATALTGIGAILTIGFAIWDTAWILKYMVLDGLSFWSATSKQMIGVDLFDKDVQKELDVSDDEKEAQFESKIEDDDAKKEKDKSNSPTIGDRLKSFGSKLDTGISMIPGVGSVYQLGKKALGLGQDIKSNKTAETAADIITRNSTENPTKGYCAKAVNTGLRGVGIDVYGNGWQADQNLTSKGWVRVFDGSTGQSFSDFKPQKGDVISIGRPTGNMVDYNGKKMPEVLPSSVGAKGGRVYGHTAIYNGSKWVSDFVQQSGAIPYSGAKNAIPYTTVLRMPDKATDTGEQGSGGDISDFEKAKYSARALRVYGPKASIANKLTSNDRVQNSINIDTRSITDVLRQSLQVHMQSRDLLEEIRDAIILNAGAQAQIASQSTGSNVMPESVIRLSHNYI